MAVLNDFKQIPTGKSHSLKMVVERREIRLQNRLILFEKPRICLYLFSYPVSAC